MNVFGIVGWKNSGKTTLVERLVTEISSRGFSVSTIKHAHHTFDIDQPGKDSHRHRMAGASEVLLASSGRWVLMHELRGAGEPALPELLAKLVPVDLVLVEGYKAADHSKIEVRRETFARQNIAANYPGVVAIAAQGQAADALLPVFDPDDVPGIASFILDATGLALSPV